jgi:hypothetical protein
MVRLEAGSASTAVMIQLRNERRARGSDELWRRELESESELKATERRHRVANNDQAMGRLDVEDREASWLREMQHRNSAKVASIIDQSINSAFGGIDGDINTMGNVVSAINDTINPSATTRSSLKPDPSSLKPDPVVAQA